MSSRKYSVFANIRSRCSPLSRKDGGLHRYLCFGCAECSIICGYRFLSESSPSLPSTSSSFSADGASRMLLPSVGAVQTALSYTDAYRGTENAYDTMIRAGIYGGRYSRASRAATAPCHRRGSEYHSSYRSLLTRALRPKAGIDKSGLLCVKPRRYLVG